MTSLIIVKFNLQNALYIGELMRKENRRLLSMTEEWRDVKDYKGLYQVSNMGRVKSLKRIVWDSVRGYYKTVHERILKGKKSSTGYLQVHLYQDGKGKWCYVHRLVAEAFIPNPDNLPQINHISEDKENNHVDNLEYCTAKYNINHGTHNKRVSEKLRGRKHSEEHIKKMAEKLTNHPKKSKPVFSVDKVTGEIKEYPSAHEAERQTGIAQSDITKCCQGKAKSAGGYYWHYVNEDKGDI